MKAFLADTSPDAYEKLIDRLLASPRYGERWGRFWLDLAGLRRLRRQARARPASAARLALPRLRHQSFNADKPYDRFLLEQLAGDELADYASARRSRRSFTTTSWRPASSAWPRTRPGRTSPASSRTASR